VLPQNLLVRLCRAHAALRNLDADITVASLAKASRLSRSQFIARYRAVFGDTPHQTRIRARLEHAQWLLATTDLTVTAVCMAVGFSSLGSFSRLFRDRCGESPVRYRARLARTGNESSRGARLAPHCLPLMAAAWTEPSYFSRSAAANEGLESTG
jgi:AraC-like DNA-binding protein